MPHYDSTIYSKERKGEGKRISRGEFIEGEVRKLLRQANPEEIRNALDKIKQERKK